MKTYVPIDGYLNVHQAVSFNNPIDGIVNISDADRDIIPILKILNENGIDTFESCQGGIEHAFGKPTIRFHGDLKTALKVLRLCKQFDIAYFRKYYCYESPYENDYIFCGPRWEVIFKKSQKRFYSIDFLDRKEKGLVKLKKVSNLFKLNNVIILKIGTDNENSRCPSFVIKFSGDEKEEQKVLNLLNKNSIKFMYIQMYYYVKNNTLIPGELAIEL